MVKWSRCCSGVINRVLAPFNAISHCSKARTAYENSDWQLCIYHLSQALRVKKHLPKNDAILFNQAKKHYKQEHRTDRKTVAVCGWDLSHNAAGRVLALTELYQHLNYSPAIIGCIVEENPKRPKSLWEPMQLASVPCKYITVHNAYDLLDKAIDFVSQNPFDIVHLSKPRLPNIIIGRLYELIWDTQVIMDIDDEEQGFSGSQAKELTDLSKPSKKSLNYIRSEYWLAKSVSLAASFETRTVSNHALQGKYGGVIIPHVRNADSFIPSQVLTAKMREHFGIAIDKKVVLFFGTPKPHKGLLETAQAIASLNRKDVLFLIIGDFIDKSFERDLKSVSNVDFYFLPNQPYHRIHEFVAMGDICVILQDNGSLISQYQLPAKLIDALAMGLTVISSRTQALIPLIEDGAIIESTKHDLAKTLAKLLDSDNRTNKKNTPERDYFLNKLSTQSQASKTEALITKLPSPTHLITPETLFTLEMMTKPNTMRNES